MHSVHLSALVCLQRVHGVQSSPKVSSIGGVAKVMLDRLEHLLGTVGIPGIQQLLGKGTVHDGREGGREEETREQTRK